jgi:SNF2 family DNA or RNA helicase
MSQYNGTLFEQLDVLNNVFKNTQSPKLMNVVTPHIKSNRLLHQNTTLNAMILHYLKMTSGFLWNNQLIYSKIGIVADPQGTGKTLSILSYISYLEYIHRQQTYSFPITRAGGLVENSNRYFFSNSIEYITDASSINLIIVPQHLYFTWVQELQKHTTFEFVGVYNKRILRNRTTPDLLQRANLVLTTNKMYRSLNDYVKERGIRWRHIFIDQATQIHFTSNETPLEFEFLWFITYNWPSLLFKQMWISPPNLLHIQDRIPDLHPDCKTFLTTYMSNNVNIYTNLVSSSYFKNYLPFGHSARSQLVILNSHTTLQLSYTLSPITNSSILCRQVITLNMLRQSANNTIETERVPTILQNLDVKHTTIDMFKDLHPARSALIQSKLEDDCSICLDHPDNKILVNCCMNAFCGKCILRHMLSSNTCPTCRKNVSIQNLTYFPVNSVTTTIQIYKNKHDTCIDYIKNHPNESIIIYTSFDNTYYQLLPELQKLGIQSERLEMYALQNTVDSFQNGSIKVLFITTLDFLSGLTLTKAQHLLFFYELPFFDQKELLLSSVQRLGRSTPLKVVQLRLQEV